LSGSATRCLFSDFNSCGSGNCASGIRNYGKSTSSHARAGVRVAVTWIRASAAGNDVWTVVNPNQQSPCRWALVVKKSVPNICLRAFGDRQPCRLFVTTKDARKRSPAFFPGDARGSILHSAVCWFDMIRTAGLGHASRALRILSTNRDSHAATHCRGRAIMVETSN